MTHHEHVDDLDSPETPELDRALQAMKAQSTPVGPPDDLVTSTVEALQGADTSAAAKRQCTTNRREMMFRFAKFGTLGTAASIAIVFGASVLLSELSTQSAFAQVIKNVRDATGAKYKLTQKLGRQPSMTSDSAFLGGIIRTEVKGQFVYFADTQTRETLQLIPSQKIAVRGNAGGNPMDGPISIADIMKEMTEDNGELVETIIHKDGSKTEVYQVKKFPEFMGRGLVPGKDGFKVWVDSATKLPTRMKVLATMGPNSAVIDLDFTDFEWNPVFPKGHFDMKIPDGYQIK